MSLKTVSTELEKIIPRAIIDLTKEDTEDEVDQDAIKKTVEELDETVKNQCSEGDEGEAETSLIQYGLPLHCCHMHFSCWQTS